MMPIMSRYSSPSSGSAAEERKKGRKKGEETEKDVGLGLSYCVCYTGGKSLTVPLDLLTQCYH